MARATLHSLAFVGALCMLSAAAQSADDPTLAAITITEPSSLAGTIAGMFGTFSPTSVPQSSLTAYVPSDPLGCSPYSLGASSIAIVNRGNCTFIAKALAAQNAGAAGVLVVMDTDEVFVMGNGNESTSPLSIFAVGIGHSIGQKLMTASKTDRVHLSISVYKPNLINPSEVFLISLATGLVAAGAFFSTSDLKQTALMAAIAPPQEEILEVDSSMALSFCVAGSCMLVFLFFFMNYAIYVIIAAFCIGGMSCITQFGSLVLQHFFPHLKKAACVLPLCGPSILADVIAFVPAAALVVCWVPLRNSHYGWPFQDIIGAGFLCWFQRTLRLPNIRIASLLLTIMFFFDIFWVFVSPLLFQKSVMVTVATGGDTGEVVPMLLRIPALGDAFGRDRMLGFGDIALPGLLVSYLRRHDLLSHRRFSEGYFGPALVGYFIGLCCAFAAVLIMKMGQPALLYLVPCTLGTTLLLACRAGELHALWDGRPVDRDGSHHCGTRVDCGDQDTSDEAP